MRKNIVTSLFFILYIGIPFDAQASPLLYAEIEQALRPYSNESAPGYALIVKYRDEPPIYYYSGLSNIEHQVPIGNKTVFDVGSVSKTFTGYAIALLIEENTIRLSDSIVDYIPELPGHYRDIQIQHLLAHTSGLWEWSDALVISGYVANEEIIDTDRILSLVIDNKAVNFPPGEQYNYSNTGYTILAEIISRVSGKPFDQYMHEKIFSPLKMDSARIAREGISVRNFATSYKKVNSSFVPHPYGFAAQGSSSTLLTVVDLGRWLENYHKVTLGSKSTHRLTQNKSTLNNGEFSAYGFGLSIFDGDRRHIHHSGGWRGYLSQFRHYPNDELSVGILCNSNCNLHQLMKTTVDIVLEERSNKDEPLVDNAQEGNTKQPVQSMKGDIDLKRFEGKFKVMPGWFMSIELGSTGDLIGHHQHYSRFETKLKPLDSDTLYVEGQNATITFGSQDTPEITWKDDAGTLKLEKLIESKFDTANYEAYTGLYVNKSLGAIYKVVFENQFLVIKHSAHGIEKLSSFNNEYFLGQGKFIVEIEFEFIANGKVSGLSISSPRVSSVFFKKIEI